MAAAANLKPQTFKREEDFYSGHFSCAIEFRFPHAPAGEVAAQGEMLIRTQKRGEAEQLHVMEFCSGGEDQELLKALAQEVSQLWMELRARNISEDEVWDRLPVKENKVNPPVLIPGYTAEQLLEDMADAESTLILGNAERHRYAVRTVMPRDARRFGCELPSPIQLIGPSMDGLDYCQHRVFPLVERYLRPPIPTAEGKERELKGLVQEMGLHRVRIRPLSFPEARRAIVEEKLRAHREGTRLLRRGPKPTF
jgi:hypothetical protein